MDFSCQLSLYCDTVTNSGNLMALKYSISDLFKLLHYIWKDTLKATDSVEGVDPETSSRKVQTYAHHLNISFYTFPGYTCYFLLNFIIKSS